MSRLETRMVEITLKVPMVRVDGGQWQVDEAWSVVGRRAEEAAEHQIAMLETAEKRNAWNSVFGSPAGERGGVEGRGDQK